MSDVLDTHALARMPVAELQEMLEEGRLHLVEDPERVAGERLEVRQDITNTLEGSGQEQAENLKADMIWQSYRAHHHAMIWSNRDRILHAMQTAYAGRRLSAIDIWSYVQAAVAECHEDWLRQGNRLANACQHYACAGSVLVSLYGIAQKHADPVAKMTRMAELLKGSGLNTTEKLFDHVLIELSELYLASHIVQTYDRSSASA